MLINLRFLLSHACCCTKRRAPTQPCHHRTLLHMHGEKKPITSNYAQQKSQRSITPLHAILGNLEANLLSNKSNIPHCKSSSCKLHI